MRYRNRIIVLLLGVCETASRAARTDDLEMVKEKLFQSKKEYDADLRNFKKAVADLFDKREEDARKVGDKKLVDQTKSERTTFDMTGEISRLPPASVRDPMMAARSKLDRAYSTAVKDFLRFKADDTAEATEKERLSVLAASALLYGKRTQLSTLKPFDIKTARNGYGVGTLKINEQELPSTISLHPPSKGLSQVRFTLAGKWSALRIRVGVPEFPDTVNPPASELIYEVLGDDVSLWKSKPTKTLNEFQKCEVCVQKVKVLTLRVHCPDSGDWCRASWLEPILAE